MRFSLKFLLTVLTIAVVGVACYRNYRDAEMGVAIAVPQPVAIDNYYEVPDTLLEIRSRRQVRKQNRLFENAEQLRDKILISEIRKNIQRFYWSNPRHVALLKRNEMELLEIARSNLGSESNFEDAVAAARIVSLCGFDWGFKRVRDRFVEPLPADAPDHHRLLHRFFDRQLADDREVIEIVKRNAADPESPMYGPACRFLYRAKIDVEPLKQFLQEKSELPGDPYSESAVRWLVENDTTPATLQMAIDRYRESSPTGLEFVLRTVVEKTEPELSKFEEAAEMALIQLLRSSGKQGKASGIGIPTQTSAWQTLGECGTERSIEFFRNAENYLKDCDLESRCLRLSIACRALSRMGLDHARRLLADQIETTSRETDHFDDREMLFDVAEEILGIVETTELCIARIAESPDPAAYRKLADLHAGNKDSEVAGAMIDSNLSYHSLNRKQSLEILKQINRIGSERLADIWPVPDSDEPIEVFDHRWVTSNIERQQLVDWINAEFSPQPKLTVASVLQNQRFAGDHWAWFNIVDDDDPHIEIETDHQFATIALANSGVGSLVSDEWYPLEGLVDVMAGEIADIDSDEFEVSSYGYNWKDRSFSNWFVVNGRLYRFSHEEGPNGSDDRYSAAAAATILNAVARRQWLDGRFICFDTEWGITLTMYLTESQMKELGSRFGLIAQAGFEHFF